MSEQTASDAEPKPLPLLELVEETIGRQLADAEQFLLSELQSNNPYIRDLLQHITRFRGKRLRPMLLLLTADACGGIRPAHKVLAAVVEMIHLATLVHDDVLDEADTRRHVATVNARWNNETSILFGDYLFSHSFHLASSLESTHACRQIGRATNLVCEGELSQIRERGNLELSEEGYFRIIDGKTAELTAVCGHLGAHYAGAELAVVEALERYGRYLGLAFQIADDVLDLVGNERQTGKSLGSDLEKQKLTLPLIRLLNRASESDARTIRELLLHPSPDTREQLNPYLIQYDVLKYAQQRALRLAEDACQQLEVLPASRAKRILNELATFSVKRSF